MRLSLAWLKDWIDPPVDVHSLCHRLSMAGLEVDSIEPAAPDFSGVVIGQVLRCEPHPNADKLSLCTVDIGQTLSIICGASNVRAGIKVPVAQIGAVLPGGFKIKKAKLRGIESYGMICSAAELGLAESSSGILILPDQAPIGEDIRSYLKLDDSIITLDLTPNRGDCLSVFGLAKEVSAIFDQPCQKESIQPVPIQIDDQIKVDIQAPQACPHYLCRVIQGVNIQSSTPIWMQEKLRRSGLRSIDPIVDITNFVMLELGQPMHAFDRDQLHSIQVRYARAGEQLTLLDGQTIDLKEDTLLIADQQPLALAGIMGGQSSGIGTNTKNIVLEAAFFHPTAIIGKARSYGLHTDSSHRFERGVDFELAEKAMERATALILEIAGGQAGPINAQIFPEYLPQIKPIQLRHERIHRLLGIALPADQISHLMRRLDMQFELQKDIWQVQPPSRRFDIRIEADLIEEIARIYGYDQIEPQYPKEPCLIQDQSETQLSTDQIKSFWADRDYQEVITYSFISPSMDQLIYPDKPGLALSNPISTEMSIMRVSLWPGLLLSLQYNLARQQNRLRFFEVGQVFWPQGESIEQPNMLAGLIYGPVWPEQWGAASRHVDFYDLKGDLEAFFSLLKLDWQVQPAQIQALHPGQSASIDYQGQILGYFGCLHPKIQAALDLPQSPFLFEINLDRLPAGVLPQFKPLSKYPSIRRDLALLVDQSISWQSIKECIIASAPDYLRSVHLFDVYQGDNIEEGLKSFALGLILQDYSHTLSDAEVEQSIASILQSLHQKYRVRLRD